MEKQEEQKESAATKIQAQFRAHQAKRVVLEKKVDAIGNKKNWETNKRATSLDDLFETKFKHETVFDDEISKQVTTADEALSISKLLISNIGDTSNTQELLQIFNFMNNKKVNDTDKKDLFSELSKDTLKDMLSKKLEEQFRISSKLKEVDVSEFEDTGLENLVNLSPKDWLAFKHEINKDIVVDTGHALITARIFKLNPRDYLRDLIQTLNPKVIHLAMNDDRGDGYEDSHLHLTEGSFDLRLIESSLQNRLVTIEVNQAHQQDLAFARSLLVAEALSV
ncbi:hypothetical protein DID76_03910 [Candidatus Marinamargulisbacteria bacterium SCGC AG-414-C22]|nr:hypothetical protein DID76_03910 [Candidatus Marinamargulisbacteria bacterium SCGC AG-414-C22]